MRRRIVAVSTLLLLSLVVVLCLLTWREVRQERLNRALIATIKSVPVPNPDDPSTLHFNMERTCKTAQALIRQGADPSARETEATPPGSLWQALRDHLSHR